MGQTVYVIRIPAGEKCLILLIQLRKRVSLVYESIIGTIKAPKAFLDSLGALLLLNGSVNHQLNS